MAKKNSQLVCQSLENISRKMLEEYQGIIRDFVRGRNGIYAMYRRGKLYYVGLAGSLLGRLKHHTKDHHADEKWDRFSVYLTIGPQHMKEIESLILRIADPPGNRVKGTFVKCENILPKVKAEYRRRRKEEEHELFGLKKNAIIRKAKSVEPLDGKAPVLLPYISKVKNLRARYKGKFLYAWVRRSGMVFFNGKRYTSPSAAGQAARGKPTNGWTFWTYERAPGDWVPLGELRKP